MPIPDHLREIQEQSQELDARENNDPEFWLGLYRKIDEDQTGVSIGDLFKAVKRLLLLQVERCKQKKFEEEERG